VVDLIQQSEALCLKLGRANHAALHWFMITQANWSDDRLATRVASGAPGWRPGRDGVSTVSGTGYATPDHSAAGVWKLRCLPLKCPDAHDHDGWLAWRVLDTRPPTAPSVEEGRCHPA
jgi:hypothetical protein